MPDIQIHTCSEAELNELEAKLKSDGFRATGKASQKDLLPMEYFRRSYSGNATSFSGPTQWTITCRKK